MAKGSMAVLVALLVLALHVGLGLFAANWLWTETDDPNQWIYFYGTGGCCIAPITASVGAIAVNNPRFKPIGIGMLVGLGVALVAAAVAVMTGYVPSWVTS
ncbi:O-antigen/teichoic acid export membrane protein [Actinoplanes octamycinicus]|uniref:O-antigen/teichoic acid export membrane protein n=1 Tax=Actinoplanes octamycinicus TaxID=135948 RepID=A0A7W7H6Q1_9ACTN|nr:hypothetical protein [Actinoplanes octamycinicus]MBB4744837.1 O-antigen/teichoic acid export membrane protein [Actinoplanes octamycinicus]